VEILQFDGFILVIKRIKNDRFNGRERDYNLVDIVHKLKNGTFDYFKTDINIPRIHWKTLNNRFPMNLKWDINQYPQKKFDSLCEVLIFARQSIMNVIFDVNQARNRL
jgi:hypothetical protein